jgi:HEAT repeat protein
VKQFNHNFAWIALLGLLVFPRCAGADLLDDVKVEPGPDRIHHPVKDEETHEMLRGFSREEDPVVRLEALRAFALVNGLENSGYIEPLLRDPNPRVAAQAWDTAAQCGLNIDSGQIQSAAASPERGVRAAVFSAMPSLKDAANLALLETGMKDEDPRVRRAAALSTIALFEDLDNMVEFAIEERDRQARLEVYRAILEKPNSPRTVLLNWGLSSEDPMIAAAAFSSLSTGDGKHVHVAEIANGLAAESKAVVDAAVVAVGRLELEQYTDQSIALLDTPDTSLQAAICRTLGAFKSEAVVDALKKVIEGTTDNIVHLEAADALLRIHSGAALDVLASFRQNPDPRLRAAVAERMGRWGDPAVAERVYIMLQDEDADVLDAALVSLLKLGNEGLSEYRERLRELSRTDIGTAAAQAIRALGFIEDRESIPYLMELLKRITYKQIREKRAASLEVLQQFGNTNMVRRAYDLVTKKVVPPPPEMPMVGPTFDSTAVRIEALRYIARYDTPENGVKILDKFEDVPTVEQRIFMLKFMKHLSGDDYELVPRQTFETYLVESLAPNPFPWVQPPGIRIIE